MTIVAPGTTHSITAVLLALLALPAPLHAERVAVVYHETDERRPLVLRAPGGEILARGELTQTTNGGRVTTRVAFRFDDGSLHDETVVFSQDGHFRMISDRLIQRGPAFPNAIDMSIDTAAGEARVQATGPGTPRQYVERLAMPADLANGMIPTLLKNVRPDAPPQSFSLIVATPKPRLVRLGIVPSGRERLPGAAGSGEAVHYVLKVEIGGMAGWVVGLLGRRPPDSHVWIAEGQPPKYVRSDQPFYVGGGLWRIE